MPAATRCSGRLGLRARRAASSRARSSCRACPVCGSALASVRAHSCSHACRQRAYRLTRPALALDTTALTATLRQRRLLTAQTVYECPSCEQRLLGERHCPDCQLFCRTLGLGGRCADCATIILLDELLALGGKEG